MAAKRAFITGAGSGIGRASATLFASEGARVAILDINGDGARETLDLVRKEGGDGLIFIGDVTDAPTVEKSIRRASDTFGGLDVLFNLAGGSSDNDGPITEVAIEEFWRSMRLDVFGTWLSCRYGIPELIRSGGGSVINVASVAALSGVPRRDAYTAAKGAIVALTRSLALEYAPAKVRVNTLAPGMIRTARVAAMKDTPAAQPLYARMRLGWGEPEDIAMAAIYLASDESRLTTGQVIAVDSGFTI